MVHKEGAEGESARRLLIGVEELTRADIMQLLVMAMSSKSSHDNPYREQYAVEIQLMREHAQI